MTRFLLFSCLFLLHPINALAETDCRALYEKLNAEAPGDNSNCDIPIAPYTLDECPLPTSHNSERPASHVVLMLDASGSMAAQIKGGSKMKIAKQEALSFFKRYAERCTCRFDGLWTWR